MTIPAADKTVPAYRDPNDPNRLGPLVDAEYVEGFADAVTAQMRETFLIRACVFLDVVPSDADWAAGTESMYQSIHLPEYVGDMFIGLALPSAHADPEQIAAYPTSGVRNRRSVFGQPEPMLVLGTLQSVLLTTQTRNDWGGQLFTIL